MIFTAEAYIKDMHDMSFFIRQMNNIQISPCVHGRRIYITLKDENLERIYDVLSTFESLKDEDGKNEFAFTFSSK